MAPLGKFACHTRVPCGSHRSVRDERWQQKNNSCLLPVVVFSNNIKVNGSPDWINSKGFYVIETDQEKIRTAATSCSCQDGHINFHSRHTQNEQ